VFRAARVCPQAFFNAAPMAREEQDRQETKMN
jgi:hypothetical protein